MCMEYEINEKPDISVSSLSCITHRRRILRHLLLKDNLRVHARNRGEGNCYLPLIKFSDEKVILRFGIHVKRISNPHR